MFCHIRRGNSCIERKTVCVPRFIFVFALIALLPVVACDPCKSLAEKICECELSSGQRDLCLRSIDSFSKLKDFEVAMKPDKCQEILERKSCTCMALQDGLVENCGMTR